MKFCFEDEGFDGQLQRTVGKCDAGMANVGECLYIASQIAAGDRDSWYAAWSTFADGLVAQATAAEEARHPVSAASLRLRAAEYCRQVFFWHRDDLDGTQLTTAYRASVDAFRKALPDLPRTGRMIEGDTPGYLFAPHGAGPFPTILHIGGYDNTAAELYASAYPALDRGWAALIVDPAAKPQFDALLESPAMRTLLGPRMATNGAADPQSYFQDMRRYTAAELAPSIKCPSLVTDNETDLVSTGQGRLLHDALTCPKTFRRFTRAEGAEGHCEGMAPIVFWTAAFDWLETTLR